MPATLAAGEERELTIRADHMSNELSTPDNKTSLRRRTVAPLDEGATNISNT